MDNLITFDKFLNHVWGFDTFCLSILFGYSYSLKQLLNFKPLRIIHTGKCMLIFARI